MDKYNRTMKKVYKFYDNPKIEETYALDYNLVKMIIPRLELFVEKSNKVIDWDAHTRIYGVDIIKTCNDIIDDFKFFLDEYDTDDIKVYTKSQTRLKHGFKLLGSIAGQLGW